MPGTENNVAGELSIAEPQNLDMSARLFAGMYSRPGYRLTEADARKRLAAMQDGPWQVHELCVDGTPVGFVLWVDLVEYIFVRSFAIDPKRRRGGMGRAFFDLLRSETWPAGRQIRLEVAKGGPWAFWEKLKFKAMTTGMWLFEERSK